MLIHFISSPTNDAYEPKRGLIFYHFPLSMRMEPLFTHPYALFGSSLCWISLLYKAFTLSVQCKCVNCTSMYKATYLEGFQIFFKKFLAHFFFHRGTFLVVIPHFPSYTFIGMCYHTYDEWEPKLGFIFPIFTDRKLCHMLIGNSIMEQ